MAFVEDEVDAARRTVTGLAGQVWDTLTAAERTAATRYAIVPTTP